MSNTQLVSVAELQQEHSPVQVGNTSLCWQLNLPESVPADQLGVNIRRLGGLASLAGLNELTVGNYQSESTYYTPAVSGVDPKGNATATVSGIARMPLDYHVSSVGNKVDVFYGRAREVGTLGIDAERLVQNITDSKQTVRSPTAWSKELDRVMHEGLGRLATETIIHHKSTKDLVNELTVVALICAGAMAINWQPVGTAQALLPVYMILNAREYILKRSLHREAYWSLLPFVQADRWAVAQLTARMPNRIVMAIE